MEAVTTAPTITEAPPEVYFLGELAARMELWAVYAANHYERDAFQRRAKQYREAQFDALDEGKLG